MPPVIFFLHIPKTAGTTLNGILNQHYSRPSQLFIDRHTDRQRCFEELSPRRQQNLRLVRGHFSFGLHKVFPTQSTYITCLRQPVAQTISMYRYWRDDPTQGQFHEMARSLDPEAFLDKIVPEDNPHFGGMRNFQTKMLCGTTPVDWSDPEAVLETAKHNLDCHFGAIGLTERFDESLLVFQRAMQWQRPSVYVRQKTSKKPLKVSQSLKDKIAAHSSLDLSLYQYAEEKLDASIAAYGPNFARDLQRQRTTNGVYQPAGRVYSLLRDLYLRRIRRTLPST